MNPKLYSELADWWPLLSAPADYEEEARFYRGLLCEACDAKTLLELGSGGGNNASHLKRDLSLTLVDRSAGMLATSRALNPECEHVLGDMRKVRLGHEFDAVFIHDAIMYLTQADDLYRAIETAWLHCRPGGIALLVPDCFRESFAPSTGHGGHDAPDRALRYLEWSFDPDPADDWFITHFAFLLREAGGVRVVHDEHVEGLFTRERWLELARRAGFVAEMRGYRLSDVERELELVLCRKPLS